MIVKSELTGAIWDAINRKTVIQLTVDGNIMTELERFKDKVLSVTIKRWNPKRSLNANGYYWSLVGQIAQAKHTTNAFTHNFLLMRYGTLEERGGASVYMAMADDTDVMEFTDRHLMPTSNFYEENGVMMWWYKMIKGSSKYNVEEFSRLLEGAVSEAKEMGLDTENPAEIERMLNEYKADLPAKPNPR